MKTLLLLSALLLSAPVLFSQTAEDWVWHTPPDLDEFAANLKWDSDGALWMTSGAKLVKFDGAEWTSFDSNESGYTPIWDNVLAFDFSADQKIWCSKDGRVLEFDPAQNAWTVHDPAAATGLAWDTYSMDILTDSEGHVWWPSLAGVFEYDGVGWTWYSTFNGNMPPHGFMENSYYSMLIDPDNIKWLLSATGLLDWGFMPQGIVKWQASGIDFWPGASLGVSGDVFEIIQRLDTAGNPVFIASSILDNYVLTYQNGSLSTPEALPVKGNLNDFIISDDNTVYLAFNDFVAVGKFGEPDWQIIPIDKDYMKAIQSIEVNEHKEIYIAGWYYAPGVSHGVLGYLPNSDYYIAGRLYVDENTNGAYDPGEQPLKNKIVKTADGDRIAFSRSDGEYRLPVYFSGSYDLETALPPYFSYGAPPNGAQAVVVTGQDSLIQNINFGFEPLAGAIDLAISMTPLNNANPGFPVCYLVNYKNLAPLTSALGITCHFDQLLAFQSATPAPVSIDGNELVFLPPPLGPLGEGTIKLCFTLPPDGGLIGQILSLDCAIYPLSGEDLDISNNDYALRHTITGPYDPNDISVAPAGLGPEGYISRYTPALEYTIRFQNVGSDTARNIRIANPLDPGLDIYSLDVVGYSHDFHIEYDAENLTLNWIFEDINLVDSLTHEEESHGFIKYAVAPLSQEAGVVLSNNAGIYFDFNPPILTNTVISTLADTLKTTFLETAVCNGTGFPFGGDTLTAAGVYYDTLQTVAGFDSIVALTLLTDTVLVTTFEVNVCEGDFFAWQGSVLIESGTYTANFTSAGGCDSIVILILNYYPYVFDTEEVEVCLLPEETYSFQGQELAESGEYHSQTIENETCIYTTLFLTVTPAYVTEIYATICEGEYYVFSGDTLTFAEIFIDTLTTITDHCDSVFILYLDVAPNFVTILDVEICEGQPYLFHGNVFDMAGTYVDSLITYNGCDSIVILNLQVVDQFELYLEDTICDGGTYFFGGEYLTSSGVYVDTLTASGGCDSIITLHLSVHPGYESPLYGSLCKGGSYDFNGRTLTQPGIYTDTLPPIPGCDNVVVLYLFNNPVFVTPIEASFCQGDTYAFNGATYSAGGVYPFYLTASNGCDSMVVLTLTEIPAFSEELSAGICQGEIYEFFGTVLTESGTYTHIMQNAEGCDSIITLALTVSPTYNEIFEINICQGETYEFQGNILTETGEYTAALQTAFGCDSVVTLDLHVWPVFETELAAEIEEGEFYLFGGDTLTVGGVYYDTLLTEQGCDSLLTLTLTVKPPSGAFENALAAACDFTLSSYNGVLSLRFPTPGRRTIFVYDLHGRELVKLETDQAEVLIPVGDWASGLYAAHVRGDGCARPRGRLFAN